MPKDILFVKKKVRYFKSSDADRTVQKCQPDKIILLF